MTRPVGLDAAVETLGAWSAVEQLGGSGTPLLAIDLRAARPNAVDPARLPLLLDDLAGAPWVNVAIVDGDLHPALTPIAERCDVVVSVDPHPTLIQVESVDDAMHSLTASITASPEAAVSLAQLLRLSDGRSVEQALHAESLTYGLLQTSPRFESWLATRSPAADREGDDRRRVRTQRTGGLLTITLDRPERRNAFDIAMRDQLVEALELLDLDRSFDGAVLRGEGANFSSGGDLDEFGTTPSAATGHRVRTLRNVGRLIHRVRDRLRVEVHGACVGAGIELPAFAHSVIAHPDTTFRLPEVGFGLVPGAGGTVSVSRRCGRHRTAWWALTGDTINATTALRAGLVDRIDDSAGSDRVETN